jgi:tetratricopeptide (TPR) repeat protein
MGKSEDAIADYTKSIEIHPTNEDAYINRGREFALAGDYENAKEDFSKAIEINPDSADAYLGRGIMYSLSEKRKAQSDFQIAIELFREEGDFEKAELARQMLEDLDP